MDTKKITPVEKIRINEKIKRFRREVVKTFLLLFIPHIGVCLLQPLLTKDLMDAYKFQLLYFSIYFICSGLFYFLAPKLID